MNRIKRLLGASVLAGSMFFLIVQMSAQQTKNEGTISNDFDSPDECSNPVFDYIDRYLVRLDKSAPSVVTLNEDYYYDYLVTAKDKLKKVVVEEQIPAGTVYVSSKPEAEVTGDKVVWTLYNLKKSEVVQLQLVVKATSVADFSNCATIVAYPEACITTLIGTPSLTIDNTTSNERVLLDSNVPFYISVTNTGNFCAYDVKVTDTLPSGFSHESGNVNLIAEIGTLTSGESREISIDTTAVEPGEHCNIAVVSASNADSAKSEECVVVLESGLDVTMEGPEMQFVGKSLSYEIVVTNTGDISLNDIVITDKVSSGNKLLSAPGAVIEGNIATWNSRLGAGESKSFEVTVLGLEEGDFCNEVEASSGSFILNSLDNVCTEWRGYPALLIEVIDTEDPLLVGEETTYIIQIINQGTAADTNITVDIQLPEGLSVVSADGGTKSTISEGSIKFAPYPKLNAKEIVQYRVVAKAVDVGDSRFRVQINSDLLKIPVPEEESTQVY